LRAELERAKERIQQLKEALLREMVKDKEDPDTLWMIAPDEEGRKSSGAQASGAKLKVRTTGVTVSSGSSHEEVRGSSRSSQKGVKEELERAKERIQQLKEALLREMAKDMEDPDILWMIDPDQEMQAETGSQPSGWTTDPNVSS